MGEDILSGKDVVLCNNATLCMLGKQVTCLIDKSNCGW